MTSVCRNQQSLSIHLLFPLPFWASDVQTLLESVHKMKRVSDIISSAYPDADMSRVVERIPSIFSRNATR